MCDLQKFLGLVNRQGLRDLILTCGVTGKFEFMSMNCKGNVRECCDGSSVATLSRPDYNCHFLDQNVFPFLNFS